MEQSQTLSSGTGPAKLTLGLAGGEALLSPTSAAANVAQALLSPTSAGANAAGAVLLSPTSAAANSSGAVHPLLSPKSSKLRQRHRKKAKGRVTWDEQAIAEHDKLRGTRQKIDEPDTPFVRSPQTASDSEAGPASSDDEHRHFRPPVRLPMKGVNWKPEPEPDGGSACPAEREVNATAVADRLDAWVRSGGACRPSPPGSLFSNASSDAGDCVADTSRMSSACSSRSSSSAPQRRQPAEGVFDTSKRSHNKDRRISLEEEAAPRPSSDKFMAKRAQHYNEVAAMKAFKQQTWKDEATSDSDTSDEEKQDDHIITNTNTNINTTISQAEAIPLQRRPSLGGGESAASSDREGRARLPSLGGAESAASSDREGRPRSNVSFSGGESGNESSEDFRNRRRRHYSEEMRRRDPTVAATVSSLETNTNTNLNAAMAATSGNATTAADKPNPMEEGRPPVQFEGGDEGTLSASSEEFRALRQQHYGREFEAVQRFRAESGGEEEALESSGTEEAVEEAGSAEPPQEAALQATEEQAQAPAIVLGGGRAAGSDEVEPLVTASNPANPMEPREAGVAFTVENSSTSAAAYTDGQGGPSSEGRSAADEASWRAKRNAHYSEMAAALRLSAPPPSDEEEEEEEEDN
mmetsp:Transcript_92982/g.170550  ORF Transcript_92982/g.170550 Transcript_92982/m.170550 type:complete len:637 (-) Transcript_92982:52-1962(-)